MAQKSQFAPTQHQYTTQFKKWKLTRYNKSGRSAGDYNPVFALGSGSSSSTEAASTMMSNISTILSPGSDHQTTSSGLLSNCLSAYDIVAETEALDAATGHDDNQAMNPFDDPLQPDDVFQQSVNLLELSSSKVIEEIDPAAVRHFGASPSETNAVPKIDNAVAMQEEYVTPEGCSWSDPGISFTAPYHNEIASVEQGERSVNDLTKTMDAVSVHISQEDPVTTGALILANSPSEGSDNSSLWESMSLRSQLLLTANDRLRVTSSNDQSMAISSLQYLDQLYPFKKLKKLHRFASDHLSSDPRARRTVRSTLAQADFLRVSLLLSEAFDLYLFSYILLTDVKVVKCTACERVLILRALAGCAESARSLSQIRLCQEYLSMWKGKDKDEFLPVTGFPLTYWRGHLAALESQSDYAADCIIEAATELGRLSFKDSASVTTVLVHKLTAQYRHMNLAVNVTPLWLLHAQKSLESGDFAITIAASLRKLLEWSISELEEGELQATLKECLGLRSTAGISTADGVTMPQCTLIIVMYFWYLWVEEIRVPPDSAPFTPGTTSTNNDGSNPVSSAGKETDALHHKPQSHHNKHGTKPSKRSVRTAIYLINQEVSINLFSIFAILTRMIVEQSPFLTSQKQGQDILVTIRANAAALTRLSGEDLEAAFARAYFFINACPLDLGSGLHPQQYVRALAVSNMPDVLVENDIGPDWMKNTAIEASRSVDSFSMHSPNESTSCLIQDVPKGALPQISPRSSLSIKLRNTIATAKRKYQTGSPSRQSIASQRGPVAKMLKLKRDSTGGTGSTTRRRNEAERDFMIVLGQSMTSLALRDQCHFCERRVLVYEKGWGMETDMSPKTYEPTVFVVVSPPSLPDCRVTSSSPFVFTRTTESFVT